MAWVWNDGWVYYGGEWIRHVGYVWLSETPGELRAWAPEDTSPTKPEMYLETSFDVANPPPHRTIGNEGSPDTKRNIEAPPRSRKKNARRRKSKGCAWRSEREARICSLRGRDSALRQRCVQLTDRLLELQPTKLWHHKWQQHEYWSHKDCRVCGGRLCRMTNNINNEAADGKTKLCARQLCHCLEGLACFGPAALPLSWFTDNDEQTEAARDLVLSNDQINDTAGQVHVTFYQRSLENGEHPKVRTESKWNHWIEAYVQWDEEGERHYEVPMQLEGLEELVWKLTDTLCSGRYLNRMIKYGVSDVIGEASWTRFIEKVERKMEEVFTGTDIEMKRQGRRITKNPPMTRTSGSSTG